jgi:hypothetical protein
MRKYWSVALVGLLVISFGLLGCTIPSGQVQQGTANVQQGPQHQTSQGNLDMQKLNEIKSLLEEALSIQAPQNVTLTLQNYQDMGGYYLLNFTTSTGFPVVVGVSADYEYLFLSVMPKEVFKQKIKQMKQMVQAMKQQQEEQAKPPEKKARPVVELFVMSYCPFGLQMEKAMIPVMELLQNYTNISIKFVYYAMHPGNGEVQENLRQYCIEKTQPNKYLDYLKCFVQNGSYNNQNVSNQCLDEANVDRVLLEQCERETDALYNVTYYLSNKSTWLSGRFPLFLVNDKENKKYNVQGSPTLVINGKVVSVARTPEAIKEKICESFISPPKVCSTQLSDKQAQPGFGPIDDYQEGDVGGMCG